VVELPDLRHVDLIALDTETRDDRLRSELGSGWPFRQGYLCGVSIAYRAEGDAHGAYFPIRHPDSENVDPEQVYQWLRDHIAAGVRIVTQNGLYDWGWLRAEAGIRMPEQIEEIGALATMVDENRFKYSLDALCTWRGLPGKDDTLLRQGINELGLVENKRRKLIPQNHIWQLPARYVAPYAEVDAVATLRLFEDLNPILDREGTRAAYRLECDILPMVLEMRLRGIRVDLEAAARAHDLLLGKRDAALAALSKELGCTVSMHELQGRKWLVETFERHKVPFPLTAKGNPSFSGGKLGWMAGHAHWLPRLIAEANKYDKAAGDFLQAHIIGHAVNGRLHAEINPHRSEDNGTKSSRFSYSDPPLQQMPSRDPELAPLIRGVFLPEDGEVWAKPDASQQEFRFVVHYANQHRLRRADEAVARYRDDANADFHALAAAITGLDRTSAKAVNFAKIYGAGVTKFAAMIGKPVEEAQRLYEQYDRELPFLHDLSDICGRRADTPGYITLYDGARRHFNRFAPPGKWSKGAGPCEIDEAHARVRDPGHPWYRQRLARVDRHTALNALIQGSAARHTKLWMRAVWRAGIVPLLQMHDCLDCSVSSREQAELVARLGCEAVQLDVPMRVDLKYGRTWGDASHTWDELNGAAPPIAATVSTISISELSEGPQWSTPTIVELVGVMPWDIDPPPPPPPPPGSNGRYPSGDRDQPERGRLVAQYVYLDAGGRNYLQVRRYEWFTTAADGSNEKHKSFPQYRWAGTRWEKGAKGLPKIPFRLPELIAAPRTTLVPICAGEKDVLAMVRLGYVATTNPGGEIPKAWTPELNCWFVGRPVIIVEDNDDTGRAHTREVAQALAGVAASIKVLRFPDVPEHEDVTWWVEQGHGKDELDARIAAAQPDAALPPLPYINMSKWDDEPIPELEWGVFGRYPMRQTVLLSGEGAAGKSTINLQLAAAHVLGKDWLGTLPEPGAAMFIDAEDDERLIHRRLADVCNHYHVRFADLIKGGLHLVPLVNEDAILAVAARGGKIEPTLLYRRLLRDAGEIRPKLISIASSANVFAGSEIDRSQVQQFIGLLTRVAIVAGGYVCLITHPSLTGISSDTGLSGNTQWHNAVRARAYLKSVKPEAGEQLDNDLRELAFKKNNYARREESIVLRYQSGLYLPVPGLASLDKAASERKAEDVFIELLKRFTRENRFVGSTRSPIFAPAVFAREEEATRLGIGAKPLEAAMTRLFKSEKISNESHGPPSKPRYHLALK
jgi:RecA-family ATPase/DNA polymerase I-like protein with 3'-5' exonuclease and polymerase domains